MRALGDTKGDETDSTAASSSKWIPTYKLFWTTKGFCHSFLRALGGETPYKIALL